MLILSTPKWASRKDIHTELTDLDHEYDIYLETRSRFQLSAKQKRAIFLNTRKRNARSHARNGGKARR